MIDYLKVHKRSGFPFTYDKNNLNYLSLPLWR